MTLKYSDRPVVIYGQQQSHDDWRLSVALASGSAPGPQLLKSWARHATTPKNFRTGSASRRHSCGGERGWGDSTQYRFPNWDPLRLNSYWGLDCRGTINCGDKFRGRSEKCQRRHSAPQKNWLATSSGCTSSANLLFRA
jgi:hypothetical protein